MDEDSILLQRFVRAGDRAAFAELVSRHAGMVRGVAWRRTQDWGLAEEIAQNVFAILARKASSFTAERLAGWLHHTTMFEARNAARKSQRYQTLLRAFSDEMKTQAQDQTSFSEEIAAQLDDALLQLPLDSRHLVVLHYFEQRAVTEIARETGKSVEACYKQIQRALQNLESRLRRRGCAFASLTSTLATASLCAPSTSTGSLAAAALKSAPTLTTANLATHTLYLMNTATTLKICAAVLILAAIPITILWRENAELRATVSLGHTGKMAAAFDNTTLQPSAASSASEPRKSVPSTAVAPASDSPDTALAAMIKKAEAKAGRQAEAEFTRISLNLPNLSEDQKFEIKRALQQKGKAQVDDMLLAFQSGAVARGLNNPANLTDQDKAALAKMAAIDPRKTTPVSIDDALRTILTPEQFTAHHEATEAKRVSDAEDAATDTLKFIGRSFDLTAAQKDQIFQQLAQSELAPAQSNPPATDDPFPSIGSKQAARDQIIRAHLTPAQAEIFDQNRAAEAEILKKQMMEFYEKTGGGQKNDAR